MATLLALPWTLSAGTGADDPTSILPGSIAGTYTAATIPGGFTGAIDPNGFELLRSAPVRAVQRITVLGHGRAGGELILWKPASPYLVGNELLYPGDGMAVHYQHSAQGLRQNFIMYERPPSLGDRRQPTPPAARDW